MSFKLLTTLALAAVALAAPRAAESLKVTVTPAAASFKSSEVKLTATVSNPTDQDIKVIKFGTVLDELPTYTFKATKDDEEVGFSGIRVTPDFENEATYVIIPAGGSVSVNHTLGSNYNYGSAGVGKYSFQAAQAHFQTQDFEILDVKIDAVDVDITEAEELFGTQTTTVQCPDGGQQNLLATMLSEARALAGGAAYDVNAHPNSGQYASYFGNNDRGAVYWQLDTIAGDLDVAGRRIMSCVDNGYCASHPGVAAWTDLAWWVPSEEIFKSDIYVCNGWTSWPETHSGICNGRVNIRGQIILHEMSHAVAKTGDTITWVEFETVVVFENSLGMYLDARFTCF